VVLAPPCHHQNHHHEQGNNDVHGDAAVWAVIWAAVRVAVALSSQLYDGRRYRMIYGLDLYYWMTPA